MPTRMRAGFAMLVATGMVVFMGGVVAGSAVGLLLRPEPDAGARPLLQGVANRGNENPTRLFANTSGGAFWSTQTGTGAAVRGDSVGGRGGVFVTRHRSASGMLAENEAETVGNGAAVTAEGNENVGLRAFSRTAALVAEAAGLALYGSGNSVLEGNLTLLGSCDGCGTTALAVNQSESTLARGDCVTVIGTTTADEGQLVLGVAPVSPGQYAIGIVVAPAVESHVSIDLQSDVQVYESAEGAVESGGALRVAISGIVEYARADSSGGAVQAGDSLACGHEPGILAKAPEGENARSIGFALGPIDEGRVAMLISAH